MSIEQPMEQEEQRASTPDLESNTQNMEPYLGVQFITDESYTTEQWINAIKEQAKNKLESKTNGKKCDRIPFFHYLSNYTFGFLCQSLDRMFRNFPTDLSDNPNNLRTQQLKNLALGLYLCKKLDARAKWHILDSHTRNDGFLFELLDVNPNDDESVNFILSVGLEGVVEVFDRPLQNKRLYIAFNSTIVSIPVIPILDMHELNSKFTDYGIAWKRKHPKPDRRSPYSRRASA